ncbi:MAG: hypothetical protein KJO77_01380 [Bacteroidia bacterium]|nr:hypothetical protein [Bacteroidia bacterium]
MKFRNLLYCLGILFFFQSCMVTESIVFNDDGSGDFLVTYDLSGMSDQMDNMFGPSEGDDMDSDYEDDEMNDEDDNSDIEATKNVEEETPEKVVDTLVYFDELMVQYKDSISNLPENEQKALESLKGMYMSMKNDDANDIFEMGIGIKFKSIEDLKDIQDRVETAKTMNSKGLPVDTTDENSPVNSVLDTPENDVTYSYSQSKFSRVTTILEPEKLEEEEVEEEGPDEFGAALKEAVYYIKYTFPRKIKSVSVEDAEISEDGKTVSFYANWMDYIKNPLLLDVEIAFEDE